MKRLLIVEDNAMWSQLFGMYGQQLGAQTLTVMSGEQAIEAIDQWLPDALVLDLLLAGETGLALLNELQSHENLSRLPIVVCSNAGVDQRELAPFGIKNVLNKATIQPSQVRQALQEVLQCD